MTPDVIVSWPRSCDYPVWRAFIAANRERFAKVIVVFTDHHRERDLSPWIRENFPDVTFIDSPRREDCDWRDVAVNAGLQVSDADWVWFTEQDFLLTDPERFWAKVDSYSLFMDAIGWHEHNARWHPSCLFVRREVIEATSRYFGPVPQDHFYVFGLEAAEQTKQITALPQTGLFRHLAGTSDNHRILETGDPEDIYKPDQFRGYLRDCLSAGVPLEPGWERITRAYVGDGGLLVPLAIAKEWGIHPYRDE